MTTVGALYINDRDVEADFSFFVSGLSGWPGNLASAPRDVPLLEGPEMQGAIVDSRLIRRKAATANASGIILTPSAAAALIALDALRGLVLQGQVMVRTFYAPDRQCLSICTGFDGGAHQPEILDGNVNVTLAFIVKDGVAVRTSSDGYALGLAPVDCPIGTAESRPVITINGGGGALTNPTITVRNASGAIVQTMVLVVTLASTDELTIDCARCTITRSTAGVLSDGLAAGYWGGVGSGDFPVLRPYDGVVESMLYPTVALSAASGVPAGSITYTRAYL